MDIRPADLPLLVSLDVLLDERNVTRAAARLHLSQPALSAQLARLRELFGDPLLIPADNGRGMVATARAEGLKDALRAALDRLGAAVELPERFDPGRAERTFTIAANDNMTIMFGLDLARRVAQQGPRLRLRFVDPDYANVAGQLARGEVDLLLASTRLMPPALRARPLSNENYVAARRKRRGRAAPALTLDAYCALPHVLVSAKGDFHGFIDDRLAQLGRRRRVAAVLPHYSLVPPLLRRTDHICTLPERFLRLYAGTLELQPLPFELQAFPTSMGWHPRSDLDPGHRWLRDLVDAMPREALDPHPT